MRKTKNVSKEAQKKLSEDMAEVFKSTFVSPERRKILQVERSLINLEIFVVNEVKKTMAEACVPQCLIGGSE